jgi:hypothetical protein
LAEFSKSFAEKYGGVLALAARPISEKGRDGKLVPD